MDSILNFHKWDLPSSYKVRLAHGNDLPIERGDHWLCAKKSCYNYLEKQKLSGAKQMYFIYLCHSIDMHSKNNYVY